MYSRLWSPGLRQGDVLANVPFPTSPKKFEWRYQGTISGTLDKASGYVGIQAQARNVMVLSHDCEFNEGKRAFFVVARIESVSASMTAEQVEALRYGNDIRRAIDEGKELALDTFLIDPVPGLFDRPQRVNFCALTSLPVTLAGEVTSLKRAELEHQHRVLLRRKVGVFFGRDADDIPDAEKHDPAAGAEKHDSEAGAGPQTLEGKS